MHRKPSASQAAVIIRHANDPLRPKSGCHFHPLIKAPLQRRYSFGKRPAMRRKDRRNPRQPRRQSPHNPRFAGMAMDKIRPLLQKQVTNSPYRANIPAGGNLPHEIRHQHDLNPRRLQPLRQPSFMPHDNRNAMASRRHFRRHRQKVYLCAPKIRKGNDIEYLQDNPSHSTCSSVSKYAKKAIFWLTPPPPSPTKQFCQPFSYPGPFKDILPL